MNSRILLAASRLMSPSPDGDAAADATKDATENASFAPSDLIPAGIILALAIAIGIALRFMLAKIVDRRSEILGRLAGRFVLFIAVCVGIVYSLANVGVRIGPLVGALGIGGFALAFALRDTLENLISGVILQLRQPFDYNDIVELGEYEGSVTDIDLRSVSMTLFSGEHVIIPSKEVLQNPIENWTKNPTRRIDVDVGVSYDVEVERACELIARALTDVDGVLSHPAPDCVFSGFGDSSINLTARVWYESRGPYFDVLRRTAQTLQTALASEGVEIPFPTRSILDATPSDDGQTEESGSPESSQTTTSGGSGELPATDADDRADDATPDSDSEDVSAATD